MCRSFACLFALSFILATGSFASHEAHIAPRVVPVPKVNTAADEDDPCIAADGLSFFYCSNATGKKKLMVAWRDKATQHFNHTRSLHETASDTDECSPFFVENLGDGWDYLYYASQMGSDKNALNHDLYFLRRVGGEGQFQGKSAAAPLHLVCTPAEEMHPWIIGEGKEMYFSRKTTEGWRVFRATASFRRAFEKEEILDLPLGLHHATVSRDGKTMYLQGSVEEGKEKLGLFVSTRKKIKDAWGKPVPLAMLNTSQGPKGDCSPCLNAKGDYLYFASDRDGGQGGLDLYVVATRELKVTAGK
jgi:hypothetical protein